MILINRHLQKYVRAKINRSEAENFILSIGFWDYEATKRRIGSTLRINCSVLLFRLRQKTTPVWSSQILTLNNEGRKN